MVEVNEFLVLDFVREQGETTRPQIAETLGLSPSSVSRIVRRLVEEHVVREVEGDGEQTGGRPRTTISFNRQAGAVIGVDLGGTKCRGFLADLGGDVLQEESRPTTAGGAPYPTLVAVIDALMARAVDLHRPVEAIAVGVPAIVDPVDGLALA